MMKQYIALFISMLPTIGFAMGPARDINRDRYPRFPFPTQRIVTHEDTALGIREKGNALAMYAAMTQEITNILANALENNTPIQPELVEKIAEHRTTINNLLNELTRNLRPLVEQEAKHQRRPHVDSAFFMKWPRPLRLKVR